jgi:amidohydrolase
MTPPALLIAGHRPKGHRVPRPLFAAASLALAAAATPAFADPARDATQAALPELMALYRHLHANPELSLREVRTAAKLAEEARKAGFDVTERVGGTGVVAVLKNGAGPVVLIRTDMDGLPITEKTGLPFASTLRVLNDDGKDTGVMHACGHDTHMASWVGTLRNLAKMKDRWRGTVVMVAQPAEERLLGARMMLADGLYTRFPKPGYALAFHDDDAMPAGQIAITQGYALASIDSIDIAVRGVSGHGGYPHTTKDAVVLASRIVTSLQTLVSREIDPQQPAVLTVGTIRGGTKRNIVADEATMQLTVRSFSPKVREQLQNGIRRIARGEAIASGIPEDRMPTVTVTDEATPSTFNTPPLAGRLKKLFTSRFGDKLVVERGPILAGEDFGRFHLADPAIQSTIFSVGGVPRPKPGIPEAGASRPTLHSPYWAPDAEAVIGTATEAITAAALDLLGR